MKSQTRRFAYMIEYDFDQFYINNLHRFQKRFPSVVIDGIEVGYASMLPDRIQKTIRAIQENSKPLDTTGFTLYNQSVRQS